MLTIAAASLVIMSLENGDRHDFEKTVYGRKFASFGDVLNNIPLPPENQKFLQRLLGPIEITGYYATSSYIKAIRADGGRSLQIHYGWTSGFADRDEILSVVPDAEPWGSGRGTGLWGVTHPIHGHPSSGGGHSRNEQRDYGTCPTCFMELSATGACSCD